MRTIALLLIVAVLATLSLPGNARAQVTAESVRDAIDQGIQFLKGQQRRDGHWDTIEGQDGGVTALVTLSMLNAGVPAEDESIQRALRYLRTLEVRREKTYSTSLMTMVFSIAEPEKDLALIRRNVQWLERAQISEGDTKGGWGYGMGGLRADNSNCQFAILGLHEAQKAGIEVDQQVWGRAKAYWQRIQDESGGWGYVWGDTPSGSMTCAGIAALIITSENFLDDDDVVDGEKINCCGSTTDQEKIEAGIKWLGEKFAVTYNPGPRDGIGSNYPLYYLYGLERAGRLSGRRFFGDHDWYREGAEHLIAEQQQPIGAWKGASIGAESNPIVSTSFALLFLSKGKRPILISKYKYGAGDQWNLHNKGVHFLTREVEKAWKKEMNWQTIDAEVASPNDLLTSPILFISGKSGIRLAQRLKDNLRQYVEQGGFIFAEACDGDGCDGREFDRQFRRLMAEIFPDSRMEALPPDHPIWFSQKNLRPDPERPLLGIRACCRTSVIYCPRNLSCYWKLKQSSRYDRYAPSVQEKIDSAIDIGVNVLTYATNRDLKEKLDRPRVIANEDIDRRSRDVLSVPKLSHAGGADDAPGAWSNLLGLFEKELELRVDATNQLVSADDPDVLSRYPILFMHGRRAFEFAPEERDNLREYFEKGGFLFADAICSSDGFAESFREEIKQLFPDSDLVPIPPGHPIWTNQYRGFELTSVVLNTPVRIGDGASSVRSTRIPPALEGIEVDGRLIVVFSQYDISCAMENAVSTECKGYQKEDAAKIGINVLLYALLK